MGKNIAILCDSDPSTKPRPSRLIEMLKEHHSLFVFGTNCPSIQGVESFAFPPHKRSKDRNLEEQKALENHLINGDFDRVIFTPNRLILQEQLLSLRLDLIIVEDLVLLPIAFLYKAKYPEVKIMVDLREFYPLEYENDPTWLATFGKLFHFLCETYLPKIDFAITVSEGLQRHYKDIYNLDCEVFLSLPPSFKLMPSDNQRIELIYHGLISPDRDSQNLLEIGSSLAPHLHLNLIVLSNQPKFLESFVQKAQKIPSISLFAPVKLQDIIPFTNQFDLGLITLKPNGFNNTYAMPNKLFEYIQARLGIISTPLPCIKPILEKHLLGLCSQDFETSSLIALLNSLDIQKVKALKQRAHQTSQTLNLSSNQAKILAIISSLL